MFCIGLVMVGVGSVYFVMRNYRIGPAVCFVDSPYIVPDYYTVRGYEGVRLRYHMYFHLIEVYYNDQLVNIPSNSSIYVGWYNNDVYYDVVGFLNSTVPVNMTCNFYTCDLIDFVKGDYSLWDLTPDETYDQLFYIQNECGIVLFGLYFPGFFIIVMTILSGTIFACGFRTKFKEFLSVLLCCWICGICGEKKNQTSNDQSSPSSTVIELTEINDQNSNNQPAESPPKDIFDEIELKNPTLPKNQISP